MEKVRILILEDNPDEARLLKELLAKDYTLMGIASTYLEAVRVFDAQTPDLVLLDIFIDGEPEGIRFAGYINTTRPVPIVFLTNAKDTLTFKTAKIYKPYSYLLKPIQPLEIQFAIELAIEKYAQAIGEFSTKEATALKVNENIFLKKNNLLMKVVVADIYYIESDDKYCFIFIRDTRFLVQQSLKRFARIFPDNFVSLHRKYIINLNQVASVYPDRSAITLKNKVVLPISQRHRKDVPTHFTIIK